MNKKQWANFPFNPGKWPFFYGWMILLWGSMGIVMSIPGQTMGVSVFTDHLLANLHISRDQLSLAYMFGTIFSSFLLPWAGMLYDKIGVRPVAMGASIGLGIILLVLSKINVIVFDLLHFEQTVFIVIVMVLIFFMLRFFGQGVLTIVSRNMMAQWFDKRRGFATGFGNVFVSLGFSAAPIFLNKLIDIKSWDGAYLSLAIMVGIIFPFVILIFFRNKPEDSGLLPDGDYTMSERKKKLLFPVKKEFTLKEALNNYAFWVFALMLAMHGLYVTGITFHVISIFKEAGLPASEAITIFLPISVTAIIFTLFSSSLSDFIQLKYLLILKGFGAILSLLGLILLGQWPPAIYFLIIGTGIMSGLFSVITTVTWPRYFGREHLGAISGHATMLIVFGSSLGPILFSGSLTYFGSYETAGWICLGMYLLLVAGSIKANNPQLRIFNDGMR